MKKYAFGIAGTLGIISTLLTLAGELPQYEKIFLVIIGISVGFFLGSFSRDSEPDKAREPMSDKMKCLLLTVIIFISPVVLLMMFITLITSLGLINIININAVLGWSLFGIIVAYITAGVIVTGWKGGFDQPNK